MRTVTLGGVPGRVVLGEGIPKTIVPLTASSLEALLAECAAAAAAECDIVEWRIDHFAGFRAAPPGDAPPGAPSSGGVDSILEAASHLTAAAGRPLLATFRTASEGGASAISPAEYEALLDALVRGGGVQAVDVEHFRAPGLTARVAEAAHAAGVAVVASYHDFGATPPRERILARLAAMAGSGADVAKIACMPKRMEDVLTLLAASSEASRTLDAPIIAVSMGPLGVISRGAAGQFGSCATFAAVGEASAPGQVPLAELEPVLRSFARWSSAR